MNKTAAQHKRRNFSSEKEIQDKAGKGNGMMWKGSITLSTTELMMHECFETAQGVRKLFAAISDFL